MHRLSWRHDAYYSRYQVAGTDMVLSEFSENQSVADNIGRLILEKYDELMVNHAQISRRKVIFI